jgi:hypothetical protein
MDPWRWFTSTATYGIFSFNVVMVAFGVVALGLRIVMLLADRRAGKRIGHHALWIIACFMNVSINGFSAPIFQVAIIGYTLGQLSLRSEHRSSEDRQHVTS